MKKHLANIITGGRIVCSLWLMFFPVFSASFAVLYLLCGLTDVADGMIARKTNTVTTFGARLDSAADVIFVVIASIKLLPTINLSLWLWSWIVMVLGIKLTNVVSGFVREKKVICQHTMMNKVTGLLLFLLPLTIRVIALQYSAVVVCAVATVAAVQEGYYIRTGRMIV